MVVAHQPILQDDYYVTNFHALTDFVMDHYDDLLLPEEIEWFDKVKAASGPAQRLYIRLLTRKRSVFRLNRLDYPEIKNIDKAARELASVDLANTEPPPKLDVLLPCFTKPELLRLLDLAPMRKLPRVALSEHLSKCHGPLRQRYIDRLQSADQWITVEGYRFWMLMQLCFFGNPYQDSREFVLAQIGTSRYEDYPLDRSTRMFQSREQIEAHWRYFECQTVFECIDIRSPEALLDLAACLPHPEINDFNLSRRVDRLRNRIARQLERLACHEAALTLYKLSNDPPARERRVRLLMGSEQWQAAADLLRQMQHAPRSESERLVAQRLDRQCRKATGSGCRKHRVFKPPGSKLVLLDRGLRVEELARRYYSTQGKCVYTENNLVTGVLGLFIWDILFLPLPGVFFNPFQIAPADYNQPEFCLRRAALLENRFKELQDPAAFSARVQSAFQRHYGKLNPFVRWQRLSSELLALATDRIPAPHWLALFQRILSDPREYTTGFPDLVLFPEQGAYEFIEIKGPGDTLQANQRQWMEYFDAHGIACRLVHVRYRSSVPMHADINRHQ